MCVAAFAHAASTDNAAHFPQSVSQGALVIGEIPPGRLPELTTAEVGRLEEPYLPHAVSGHE